MTKILSNQDTKKAIMDTIANDINLSVEMMETMMNGKMMMQNQGTMMTIMQNNPAMMQSMMSGMIETFNGDTAMMSSMSAIMLNNPQMMNMIHKNMGMNNMDGMYHQTNKI